MADLQRLAIFPVSPGTVYVQVQPQTMSAAEVKEVVRSLYEAAEAATALENGGLVRPTDATVVELAGRRKS